MLDASTFTDLDLIKLSEENFISLKIDAETKYGLELFNKYDGTGYPLIIFLNSEGKEVDRFYGYIPAYEFIIKMNNVLDGENTFVDYLDKYEKGNHSAEILKPLADKYRDKGDGNAALNLYQELLQSSNVSKNDFNHATYNIASLSLTHNQNLQPLLTFLSSFEDSENFENGVYQLINYYKSNQMQDKELNTYNNYLEKLNYSHRFLNSYAWRMSELDINLDDALKKVNLALLLIDQTNKSYTNILDTKAEVLWKLGDMKQAIQIIDQALLINPDSKYYQTQKEKFLNSIN